MSGTAYWSYPILTFGIVACTFFWQPFWKSIVYPLGKSSSSGGKCQVTFTYPNGQVDFRFFPCPDKLCCFYFLPLALMRFHYYDCLFPWHLALSDTKKKLKKYYVHSSLGLQVTECYLPIHLIKEVKICRYFVFCTLKKVNGPNVTAKIACKQQKIRVRLQYIWAVFWGDAIFLLFLVCLAVLNILRSGLLFQHINFYSFMPFMHKISTWVVRVNGKHPKLVQQQRQQQQQQQESKACFKRRATTVLSWLDCSSTQ